MLTAGDKITAMTTLATQPREQLIDALISAANENIELPGELGLIISPLQLSLRNFEDIPNAKEYVEQAIVEYIQKKGIDTLINLLSQQIIDETFKSSFLLHMINRLNIEIHTFPIVELCIFKAKIYWQIIQAGKTLFQCPALSRRKSRMPSDATITMSWERFRQFKDAGKRHGSVVISKELFIAKVKQRHVQEKRAIEIWDELHEKGVLNNKHRFSNEFRYASGSYVKLTSINGTSLSCTVILSILYQIIDEESNAKMKVGNYIFTMFRPERNSKKWETTGRITFSPRSRENKQKLECWDVGIYSEFTRDKMYRPSEHFEKLKPNRIISHLKLHLMILGVTM